VRWLIDGMNLIGARPDGWWHDHDRAMRSLVEMLDSFATHTGDEITVVFERAPKALSPASAVHVVIARWTGRNAADHEIELIVENDDDPKTLRVVTSDKRLAEKVRSFGATTVSSGSFRSRLEKTVGRA
jgi:predicted RNA-binding protein with PIN domain